MAYTLRAFPVAALPVPGWECFFGRHDVEFHTLMFYVWFAQGEGKTIVIDAGPPPGEKDFRDLVEACQGIDPKSLMRRVRSLKDVFADAHVKPEEVDYLLITQPITYHSGGLVPEYFPRANVYLSKAGFLEFALDNPGHPPRHAYFTESTWAYLRQLLIENRLHLTDEPREVLNGLWFETTGGHHPGSAAVRLQTGRGLVGILETAFLKENVDRMLPVGVSENAAVARQAIRRYVKECGLVLAAHDNTIMERFPGGKIA